MPFTGFSKDTVAYLRELAANNDKKWFEAHRERLDAVWLEPAKDFVVAVGQRVKKFAPSIEFEPRVGGSLMRMHRDVRFAKDKSPYKTHFDAWFWDGDEKGWGRPGFFFRLTPNELMCGAGMHGFEKDVLAKYRAAVDDGRRGPALQKIVTALRKAGLEVGSEAYKKVPKGFSPEHPRAELLRFGGLHAGRTTPVPKELTSAKFVDVVVERFREASPLRAWLASVLDE
jgi:uncharacterized protein (TIGR02453 family)